MCNYIRLQLMRSCDYLLFMIYIYNENKERDKNILLVKINNSLSELKSESKFKFSCAKLKMIMNLNMYTHMYSSYSNYTSFFRECIAILELKDDEKVIEELNTKLGKCNDLFIIYLFYSIVCP